MKENESSIELEYEEAINNYDVPECVKKEENKKNLKIIASKEFVQDFNFKISQLCKIKGSEISPEEIDEWKNAKNYLDCLNIEEIKKRVQILNQENPYKFCQED